MSILEHVQATWFLARINLRKGRRNLLQISNTDSNKITLLHSFEWQGRLYENRLFEGKYDSP
jgi:hypothetical protein